MKPQASVTHSDKRLLVVKEKNKQLIVQSKTELCYNCNKNLISPYEVEHCDFCADNLRYTPRTF